VFLASLPQGSCGEMDKVGCFDVDHYIREMFVNSDTSVAVLSALPGPLGANGLEPEEMASSMEIINTMADSQRLVIHAIVHPEEGPQELDRMQQLAETYAIGAWKVYTPLNGWRLDDPAIGIPFIEKARALGIKNICAHKGLPLQGFDPAFASPDDVGIVAAAYPDVNFVVYHSAYEIGISEGPYDPLGQGIDRLIKAVLDNGIAKNTGNVYAELGSTWRLLMTSMDTAAHAVGKLVQHLGEDRVVWGTDSIWYGTPQDQIMAFRAFEISQMFQDTYGYPALSDGIKAKIFGLNSAAIYGIDPQATLCAISEDAIAREKQALLHEPSLRSPSFRRNGPQTRREWFDFLRFNDGKPG
jgi:predicted TIM-barrel fold metal-dependent hydrolase